MRGVIRVTIWPVTGQSQNMVICLKLQLLKFLSSILPVCIVHINISKTSQEPFQHSYSSHDNSQSESTAGLRRTNTHNRASLRLPRYFLQIRGALIRANSIDRPVYYRRISTSANKAAEPFSNSSMAKDDQDDDEASRKEAAERCREEADHETSADDHANKRTPGAVAVIGGAGPRFKDQVGDVVVEPAAAAASPARTVGSSRLPGVEAVQNSADASGAATSKWQVIQSMRTSALDGDEAVVVGPGQHEELPSPKPSAFVSFKGPNFKDQVRSLNEPDQNVFDTRNAVAFIPESNQEEVGASFARQLRDENIGAASVWQGPQFKDQVNTATWQQQSPFDDPRVNNEGLAQTPPASPPDAMPAEKPRATCEWINGYECDDDSDDDDDVEQQHTHQHPDEQMDSTMLLEAEVAESEDAMRERIFNEAVSAEVFDESRAKRRRILVGLLLVCLAGIITGAIAGTTSGSNRIVYAGVVPTSPPSSVSVTDNAAIAMCPCWTLSDLAESVSVDMYDSYFEPEDVVFHLSAIDSSSTDFWKTFILIKGVEDSSCQVPLSDDAISLGPGEYNICKEQVLDVSFDLMNKAFDEYQTRDLADDCGCWSPTFPDSSALTPAPTKKFGQCGVRYGYYDYGFRSYSDVSYATDQFGVFELDALCWYDMHAGAELDSNHSKYMSIPEWNRCYLYVVEECIRALTDFE